jgi:hypothetical protein
LLNRSKITCPCGGYKTLATDHYGSYSICEVCFWEDDEIQLENPTYTGGANKFSLIESQKNFIEFGACDKEMIANVRNLTKDEIKDENWKPF